MESPVKVRNLPNEKWAEVCKGYYVSNMGAVVFNEEQQAAEAKP